MEKKDNENPLEKAVKSANDQANPIKYPLSGEESGSDALGEDKTGKDTDDKN